MEHDARCERKITKNAARCRTCNSTIESRHRHDFRSCKCGAVSVDGGKDYLRRLFDKSENVEELSEYTKECACADRALAAKDKVDETGDQALLKAERQLAEAKAEIERLKIGAVAIARDEVIRRYEREQTEDRAAIREAAKLIPTGGSMKTANVWWHEKHAPAIQRATEHARGSQR